MKIYRQVVPMLGFACILIGSSGCVSYHVAPDPRFQGEAGCKVIDTAIKKNYSKWSRTPQIGANEDGFTIIRTTHGTINQRWDGNEIVTYGKAETHRWVEVEDITVRAAFGTILLLFGTYDPTFGSGVRLRLTDGTDIHIGAGDADSILAMFPFWMVNLGWYHAHKLGKACQSIVESARTKVEPSK